MLPWQAKQSRETAEKAREAVWTAVAWQPAQPSANRFGRVSPTRAEHVRREQLGEDHVRRTVSLHHAVRHDRVGCALVADLLLGLSEAERVGLREHVRRQDVVVLADRVRVRSRSQLRRPIPVRRSSATA